MDGHSSHFTLPLCKFCQENQIEIIGLYPNATHIIQPLDVAFFHPLKDRYKDTLRKWRIENNVLDFKKSMFAEVLKLVLEANDFSKSIVHGFKSCGLYPFDADAVDYNILNKRKKRKPLSASTEIDKSLPASTKECDDNQKLLQLFETDMIPSDVLEEFKKHELTETWNGELRYEGLFESWLKLRKLCGKNAKENNILDISLNDDTTNTNFSYQGTREVPATTGVRIISNDKISTKYNLVKPTVQENPDLSNTDALHNIDTDVDDIQEIYLEDGLDINHFIEETQTTPVEQVELYDEFGQRRLVTVVAVIDESKDISNVLNHHQQELTQSTDVESTHSIEDQVPLLKENQVIPSIGERSTDSAEDQVTPVIENPVTPLTVDEDSPSITDISTHSIITPRIVDDTSCSKENRITNSILYDMSH